MSLTPTKRMQIRALRDQHWSMFRIAEWLKVSLTDVRLALDPKADQLHRQWAK